VASWEQQSLHLPAYRAELDGPIFLEEVRAAVADLRKGKACGVDGVFAEILKFGGEKMEDTIWRLCQVMFACEQIPQDWSRGIIFPLHKEGDERLPTNYRGITLLSVVGKLYTAILTKRVSEWCEEQEKISDEQAGFRPNRSITDQIFLLKEIIQMRRETGKDTYCCFLDIKKAYDTTFRDGVWKRLLEIGVNGKLWRVLRNLYESVESCVRLGSILTDYFRVALGLRQGDSLSPILYAIFLDGLIQMTREVPEGVRFGEHKMNILGFADDLVLIANSKEDLQKLLDRVYLYSCKWRFLFNCAKSKVLIFSNRRVHLISHPLYLGIDKLEQVKMFKYLGVWFTANLNWNMMKQMVIKKARLKIALTSRAISQGLSPEQSLKLYFTLIRPVLEFSIECWGLNLLDGIERVQLQMGRIILGVSSNTTSDAVRGELGLWTMKGRRDLAILRWWGKLVRMDRNRLCARVYRHRKLLLQQNRNTPSYCKAVRDLLSNFNLYHVWMSEEVGEARAWSDLISAKIRDRERREWKERVFEKEKLRNYRVWKTDLIFEDYLNQVPLFLHRREITRFRCGTHHLRVETGRWERTLEGKKLPFEQRTCYLCMSSAVETEEHVMLDCPAYNPLRWKLLASIRNCTGDAYQLKRRAGEREWLMNFLLGHGAQKPHKATVRKLVGKFLARAMKVRRKLLGV